MIATADFTVVAELSAPPAETPGLWKVNVPGAAQVIVVEFWELATVSVKLWVAFGRTPLEAVMETSYEPAVPAPGVPDSTPVVALSDTPLGNEPVSA